MKSVVYDCDNDNDRFLLLFFRYVIGLGNPSKVNKNE